MQFKNVIMDNKYKKELKIFGVIYSLSLLTLYPIFIVIFSLLEKAGIIQNFEHSLKNIVSSIESILFFFLFNLLPYFLYLIMRVLFIFFKKIILLFNDFNTIIRSKSFIITLLILTVIHSYIIFPKLYILYLAFNSRDSAYLNGISIIFPEILLSVLVVILSFFFVFLLLYTLFSLIKNRQLAWLKISISLLICILFYTLRVNIYGASAWFENTFTTEMKNMWGPTILGYDEIQRGKIKSYGQLKIDYMTSEESKRLQNIFSDIDTNDWIITTIFLYPMSIHWESHPFFIYFSDNEITRLENFKKEYVTFLFKRKISKDKVPEIYETDNSVYLNFWKHIHDTTIVDSLELRNLYSKIDSLIKVEQ